MVFVVSVTNDLPMWYVTHASLGLEVDILCSVFSENVDSKDALFLPIYFHNTIRTTYGVLLVLPTSYELYCENK